MINVFSPTPVESANCDKIHGSISDSKLNHALFLGRGDRLEEFLAGIPGVLYECDEDFSVTRISTNARELLGVESVDLLGRRDLWGDRLYPKDRITLISRLEQLQFGQGTSAIHRIISECEFPLWVSHGFKKVRTNIGESIWGCLLPLPTDLCTQSVDSAIISQFIHKIGNHFQLINLLVGALRRSGVGLAEIDPLQAAVDRTAEFTRAFLDYAQIPSAQSDFELREILNVAVEVIQLECENKKVSLSSCLDDRFSNIWVHGDPLLFERALGAIFQNALDATSAGDEVRLVGKCDDYPSASILTAQIVIADTGSGMQIENLQRADTPFFSTRQDGSGLGLSMAARIIEQHGGTLRVHSSVGQGTQVVIAFPVTEVGHDRSRSGAASKKNR